MTPRTPRKSPRAANPGGRGLSGMLPFSTLPGEPMNSQRREIETEGAVLESRQRRRKARIGLFVAGARRAAALAFAGALILPLAAEGADVVRSSGRGGGVIEAPPREHRQSAPRSTFSNTPAAAAPSDAAPAAAAPTPAAPTPGAPSVRPPAAPAPAASAPAAATPTTPAPTTPAPDAAMGFGARTTGGAGQQVVEVVNLLDNPPEVGPWPGSLRAALAGGNRTVRFRVSGSIKLLNPLYVKQPNVTIDGSDAPNGGVALYNNTLIIEANNVIVRNIRFRVSNATEPMDGLQIGGGSNILIDHISCSWAGDECIDIHGYDYIGTGTVRNLTIQNSLIAEAPKDRPYGILVDGDVGDVTFYRNVFAKNGARNPQIVTGRRGAQAPGVGEPLSGIGRYELIQNIIYDAVYATRVWNLGPAWTVQLDVIGNLWKPGLQYTNPRLPITIAAEPESVGPIKVFLADNLGPNHENLTSGRPCDYFSLDWLNAPCAGYSPEHAATSRLTSSDALPGRPASEDSETILANAGATRPCRDSADSRIVQEVRSGTGRHVDGPGALPFLNARCQ